MTIEFSKWTMCKVCCIQNVYPKVLQPFVWVRNVQMSSAAQVNSICEWKDFRIDRYYRQQGSRFRFICLRKKDLNSYALSKSGCVWSMPICWLYPAKIRWDITLISIYSTFLIVLFVISTVPYFFLQFTVFLFLSYMVSYLKSSPSSDFPFILQ